MRVRVSEIIKDSSEEREIQVRGVVFDVFNSCIMPCNDINQIV